MTSAQLLTDAFDRIQQVVHGAARGLTADQLAHRPAGGANSIAWLVWHLTRIQDDHVADAAGTAQVWAAAAGPTGSACRSARPTPDTGTLRTRSPRSGSGRPTC
ncbi:DinB family protein [Actinomadura madurae]|uniref:DinB family protein n=1 Tax=Actinomadura madurae TaxID=1993 RepID=UPI0020D22F0A|nr:DinB family protein [Actinomadura madurae]